MYPRLRLGCMAHKPVAATAFGVSDGLSFLLVSLRERQTVSRFPASGIVTRMDQDKLLLVLVCLHIEPARMPINPPI